MPVALRLVAVAALIGLAAPARAELLIGLTVDNRLVRFDSGTPGTVLSPVGVSGLQLGDNLRSIDYRPANGLLYGVGLNGTSGRVYSIDPLTGVAALASTLSVNPGPANTLLDADFNPVVDRLRVITQFGSNLRADVTTGVTAVDASLAYAAGDVNFGFAPAVVGAGYTNSVLGGAAATTLYDIELQRDVLVTQTPPNSGTLNTVGSLGVQATFYGAFDISGLTGTAYAALTTASGSSSLYTVNLSSGSASLVGTVGGSLPEIISLAAPLGTAPAVPAPAGLVLAGVAAVAFGLRRRLV